ncbi:two-component system, chemotaxis family, sensor kinase CheA [Caloranaerobacter azorensis DSM 13643]|uniref:Chemotaxis protein CheA n=1 Tax=Caloranaerobacter azorensis DSM 13643 TaxID=1121264 RepID=A0A1M5RLC9_9FIRM|nr:chemotaxis protein CheA [Caloranaerobacter azorensis]SHH26878.1 two-component system, chemotaxis family, sensor kinase CheA [Caloranaerobacter azorensis DSM 13643]
MDISQYLDIFIDESKEHLHSLNESLLSLEKNPDDKELINEIFRVAHTLKGMSGTMGFTKIASLTHEMENLLDAIRNDKLTINTDIVDLLFECFDALEEYINVVAEEGEEGEQDNRDLIIKLNSILNNKDHQSESNIKMLEDDKVDSGNNLNQYVTNVIKKAQENGLNAYTIEVVLKKDCMLKAARAFIIFNTLERYGEVVYSKPSVEDIEDENFDLSFSITILSKSDKNSILEELNKITDVETIEIKKVEITDSMDNSKVIEKTNEAINEKQNKTQTKTEKKSKKKNNKVGKTVRVDIDRLDNLMNLVSELIIIKTRMEEVGGNSENHNMNEAIEYLERITTSIHDAVMKVRMVPIDRVFNRFPRMVRDLSKDLGKNIKLIMSGEETEVDRTVIDEIGDPLIHLIRNSIDHGIESPEERVKVGKEETGSLYLRAYPDGNNVVIEVEDDGRGIDLEKVKRKAVDKKIITEEIAHNMSKEEIISLLFKAGFSTAEKISDISGRGVGLDVVKNKIEAIGGNIEVETEKGKGTKFTIRIPLTLAIIQALLIKLQDEIYALPLSSIKEITTIESQAIRKIQNHEVVLFRDKTLPIVRLNEILGVQKSKDKDESGELITVVAKKGDKEAGLIVDKLIGQQEIVIKSLGKYLSGTKYIAGATILGDGSISLILDINSLF